MDEDEWNDYVVELRSRKTDYFYCRAMNSSHAAALAERNNPAFEAVSIHRAKKDPAD